MNIEETVSSAIEESIENDGQIVALEVHDAEAAYEHVRQALDVSYEAPGTAEVVKAYRADGMHVHGHDKGFAPFHVVFRARAEAAKNIDL
jgi:hypothetical protein